MNPLELGKNGEARACEYLKAQGLEILTTNFHSRFGEIDIIAQSKETVHFIEVKASLNYDPIERITQSKYTKILKTIEYYLYRHPVEVDYQVDAIIIKNNNVEWIKNISY